MCVCVCFLKRARVCMNEMGKCHERCKICFRKSTFSFKDSFIEQIQYSIYSCLDRALCKLGS